MSLGKRLKKLREEHKPKIYQKELADIIGVSRQAITMWETNQRVPDTVVLQKLANYFDVSIDYLLGRTDIRTTLPPEAIPVGETKKIPVLGVIRAGEPIYADEHIIGYEDVPVSDVKNGEYFFLIVKGDSMINSRIHPGDKVLVRRQDYIENNEIAVVIVNGYEATLKRVKPIEEAIILYPDNPNYQPQIYKAEDIRVIGRVMKVVFEV